MRPDLIDEVGSRQAFCQTSNGVKKLIIANWKMNPASQKEAERLFGAVKNGVKKAKNAEVVICPPFVYVSCFKFHVSRLKIGSQNVFYEEKGSFTGEVSTAMLKDLGVKYVIIGHSERRTLFGETDEIINKKIKAVLRAKLKPIFCVGEKAGENKAETLESQIREGLKSISNSQYPISNLIIAYEPVWAIGTGSNCSVDATMSSILFIRKTIYNLYSKRAAEAVKIIYGGSVNSKNAASYLNEAGADGLLVGGASLSAEEFTKIVKSAQ